MTTNVNRLRWTIFILVLALVFIATAAPIYVIRYNQRQATRTELAVTCVSARANIDQLQAIAEIADRLGVPHEFTVPKEPPACDDF
jgi:hypothetical protein